MYYESFEPGMVAEFGVLFEPKEPLVEVISGCDLKCTRRHVGEATQDELETQLSINNQYRHPMFYPGNDSCSLWWWGGAGFTIGSIIGFAAATIFGS